MGKRKPINADDVYGKVKRAINDFARVVWELRDERAVEYDDPRDQDAFDALDDICLVTGEMCGLWDHLWAAIGDGRPDTIPWARRDFEQLDPEAHDHWLERHDRQLRAANELRRAIEESELGLDLDEQEGVIADSSDELEIAEPNDGELDGESAAPESVA